MVIAVSRIELHIGLLACFVHAARTLEASKLCAECRSELTTEYRRKNNGINSFNLVFANFFEFPILSVVEKGALPKELLWHQPLSNTRCLVPPLIPSESAFISAKQNPERVINTFNNGSRHHVTHRLMPQ